MSLRDVLLTTSRSTTTPTSSSRARTPSTSTSGCAPSAGSACASSARRTTGRRPTTPSPPSSASWAWRRYPDLGCARSRRGRRPTCPGATPPLRETGASSTACAAYPPRRPRAATRSRECPSRWPTRRWYCCDPSTRRSMRSSRRCWGTNGSCGRMFELFLCQSVFSIRGAVLAPRRRGDAACDLHCIRRELGRT